MKPRILLLLCVVAAMAPLASGADYASEMKRALRSTFKADYGRYQFFGLPVSNFGVGTMYPAAAKASDFDVTTAGLYGDPNTWWIDDLTTAQKEQLFREAFPGGGTGPIALKFDKKKHFSLDLVFPALAKLLSASGNIDYKNHITVALDFTNADNRRINWSALGDDTPKIKPSVVKHLQAKDYVITIGDVVLYGYSASLVVDKTLDVGAKAKLLNAWKAFSKDTSVAFSYSTGEAGNFSVKATAPVIAAIYVGEPPPGQQYSAENGSKAAAVAIPNEVIQRLSETSRKGELVPMK